MTGQNESKNPVGPVTQRTLAGFRRISRSRDQVAGVLWEEADTIVEAAVREKTLRGLRDAALIAVASDALLRVSEMVAIDVGDIERDSDGSAILHIRRSKTDQEGRGATCYLGRRTVEVLDAWMTSAGIGQHITGSGVPFPAQGGQCGRPPVRPLDPFYRDRPLRRGQQGPANIRPFPADRFGAQSGEGWREPGGDATGRKMEITGYVGLVHTGRNSPSRCSRTTSLWTGK